ncbi:EG45-like domain containing protein isoform X2 [Salvia miltiorrhiza]|uniref:EG45-like domain containing protein isoform X2 n=1 Tax=Salvia miltiorrhiza TaxID=226208 RepID=UPI0025AC217C|nr:EG45-like domain containing protein isoform X2 [Salvia miltiorrhiza]
MGLARMIMLAVAAASMISMASAIAGTATYYSPIVPSSCYGFEDRGTMVAAANPALFNNRAACGQRYTVRCTGPTNQGVPQPCRNGPITVTIVDLCPGCAADQIDLSEQAFNAIADPNAGRILIDYNPAP